MKDSSLLLAPLLITLLAVQSSGGLDLPKGQGRALPPDATPRSAGNKKALLIGISQYTRGNPDIDWWNLHSEPDVKAIRAVLIDRFGFPAENIKLLTTREETTHAFIVATFRSFLIDRAQPGDIIYIHYSGHGSQLADPTHRKLNGMHETLIPSDYVSRADGSKDILDDEVRDLLQELKRTRPANITLSIDSCFSGTVYRGGNMLVRGGSRIDPQGSAVNPAGERAGPGGLLPLGDAEASGYVALAATRSDQLAHETPPDEHGESMGLFTYALVKALNDPTISGQSTYRDLFEQVTPVVALHASDQNPQMEGQLSKLLMQGAVRPQQPYFPVFVERGVPRLHAGKLQGITLGSVFSVFAPGTSNFHATRPLGEMTIDQVSLNSARLQASTRLRTDVSLEALVGARALEKEHRYDEQRLRIHVQENPHIEEALATVGLITTDGATIDSYELEIRPETPTDRSREALPAASLASGSWVVAREDGTLVGRFKAGDDPSLRDLVQAEARWRFINALHNSDLDKEVKIRLAIIPVDTDANEDGSVRVDAAGRPTRLVERTGGMRRDAGGNVTLSPNDYFMIELTNLGRVPAYVTALDLVSSGRVRPLWPHPQILNQENRVPADGRPHRIPYPFVFRVEPVVGVELFKAIATSEPADFSPLVDLGAVQRGEKLARGERQARAMNSPLGQLLLEATKGTRSVLAVGVSPSHWATDAISVRIQPR
jgi:Caspase domain